MIAIWQEYASFQTTRQVRTIIKKIFEIHQKTNNEQDSNTKSDTLNIDKQEQSNRNEQPTSENRNTT